MRHKIARAGRELVELLAGGAIGLTAPFVLALMVFSVPASLAAGLGLFLLAGTSWLTRQLAQVQRRRAAAVLGEPLGSGYRPLPDRPLGRIRTLITDPATWRDVTWLLCQFFLGVSGAVLGIGLWSAGIECLTAPLLRALLPGPTSFDPAVLEVTGRSAVLTWLLVPVGAAAVVAAYRLPRHLLAGQARLARALLAPTAAAGLSARVSQLAATRQDALDGSAAQLRRLERDLHDGAQMRLVAMAMNLGMASDVIDADPASAKQLLIEAQVSAGVALTELRDLVRGIHPPVLADRGLDGALRALALTCSHLVDLDLRLGRTLPAPVESTVYFVVAESLTNAIRHSGCDRIAVTVTDDGTTLRVRVCDGGRGGADPARGSGLRGIQRRLSSFDGQLRISSPVGGPTVLDMELPCGS